MTRDERTSIFAKTKMCKFFILGTCAKGTDCRFAHFREELSELPDLCRTKLCKALIRSGQCLDRNCRYAHSKEELRSAPGVADHPEAVRGDQDGEQLPYQSVIDRCGPAGDAASADVLSGHPLGPVMLTSPCWMVIPAPAQDCCPAEGWPGSAVGWLQAAPWAGDRRAEAQAWLQEDDEPWDGFACQAGGQPYGLGDGGAEGDAEDEPPSPTAWGRAARRPRMASDEGLLGSPLVIVKNTFLHVDMGKPTSGLKQVSTWGGALCTSDDEDTAEGGAPPDSGQGSSGGSDGDGEAARTRRAWAPRPRLPRGSAPGGPGRARCPL